MGAPVGEIAMAHWTADGFVGQIFKVTANHVPPPPGMTSPLLWDDEAMVRQRMIEGVAELKLTPIRVLFKYPFSTEETVEYYPTYFGPTQRAFAALSEDPQPALRRDLEDHWAKYNRATDGTTDVEAEYLEVVARRA